MVTATGELNWLWSATQTLRQYTYMSKEYSKGRQMKAIMSWSRRHAVQALKGETLIDDCY